MASKFRSTSRPSHPGVVQPRGRLGVLAINQKKSPVLRVAPQKQYQDNITNGNNNDESEDNTEKQPISDFPSPPIPTFSCYRGQQGEMPTIPNLATAAHGEITSIVLQKMKLCQRSCDFSDPRADLGGKATKKATLNELIDLYSNQKLLPKLTRECHQQLIETFAANVFRSPPRIPRTIIVSDEVTIEDNAWPHLRLVYLLFIKFLSCGVEQRILQYQLTPKFISNLFSILDFPDERERVQVRSVIVTIYNKVPPQRTLLMNITLDLLMNVPENLELNAASHLLELLYQFTSNTPPPLSQQLIQAFDRILLPLHLPTHCQRYFQSLVKCILLMIRKDARLTNNVLHFLIEHWPLTLDHKTELFLDEISQVLEDSNPQDLTANSKSLFNCVSIAVESPCMTLSEKALKFLQNNSIQNLIVEDPDPLLAIIFPPIFRVTCGHWQKNVQVSALNVMNTLMELTPDGFKRAAEQFKTNSILSKTRKIQKYNMWIDVLEVSAMKDSSIDVDVVAEGIKEFYNTEKRPQSRASSSQSTSGREDNTTNDTNKNENTATSTNNESKNSPQIDNMEAIKEEQNKLKNEAEKLKNFSNPFKALASNFTRRGSAGVFHYEVSETSSFNDVPAPSKLIDDSAIKPSILSISENDTNIGLPPISDDQNHFSIKPTVNKIIDEASTIKKEIENQNNTGFNTIIEEENNNKNNSNFGAIIEEENQNDTGFNTIIEENPNQTNTIIEEESQNQNAMKFGTIIEENANQNIPGFGTIIEEDNSNQNTQSLGAIIEENANHNIPGFGTIIEEENSNQNTSSFGTIIEENANQNIPGFGAIIEEENSNQNNANFETIIEE